MNLVTYSKSDCYFQMFSNRQKESFTFEYWQQKTFKARSEKRVLTHKDMWMCVPLFCDQTC